MNNLKMRLDKWLWHARFFKSRNLATQFANSAMVRINGHKTQRASRNVRVGDVLTFALHNHIRVIEIVALGKRRGPATEAMTLYLDRAPLQIKQTKKHPHQSAFTDNVQ